jgi:response regulator NasT
MAIGRFVEFQALDGRVRGLEEQLETRKVVDRAKGMLMDVHGLSETDAFTFIQRTAMRERLTMARIAQQIIDGELTPEG